MTELLKIRITGSLQGVGFRAFIYRLARQLRLTGFVQNSGGIVIIEIQGKDKRLKEFLYRLQMEKPVLAFIYSLDHSVHDVKDYKEFKILHSENTGRKNEAVLPDIAMCNDCLKELFDLHNRRYRYPFTYCVHCGPRLSVIDHIPHERANTSMKAFQMCPACQREYENPNDKRFHDQINSCPVCGPHMELWNAKGEVLAAYSDAITQAVEAILAGKIIAVKDLGGFRLLSDARNENAVGKLREGKQRTEKPFALLYPSLQKAKKQCHISLSEKRLLLSPAAPVVLLKRKRRNNLIAKNIAAGNPYLGIMLPSTPLQHLLMDELKIPVVVSSGNLRNEPVCIDEFEAIKHLQNVADLFLVHNLPVARPVEDSIVSIVSDREQILRRAKGYNAQPLPINNLAPAMLATGAHAKNAIAVRTDKEIFVGHTSGDLQKERSHLAFKKSIADIRNLYKVEPENIICDLDPLYLSRRYSNDLGSDVIPVQHHYAHVLSCMLDNDLEGQVLGVSWDGAGYGINGATGGSEFLLTKVDGFERVGHFREFHSFGGDADTQPRLSALGILYDIFGDMVFDKKELIPIQSFSPEELSAITEVLKRKKTSQVIAGIGKLFDAVSSIIGLRQLSTFREQAAMELEFAINKQSNDFYPFEIGIEKPHVINWQPMILAIINDVSKKVNEGRIAVKFHNTLAETIVKMADKINEERVLLTGDCFQNKYLTERTVSRLRKEGFQPYWHQRIPTNDEGIPAGQLMNIFYADIIKIFSEDGQRTGKICVNGVFRSISLAMLPGVQEGDRILIRDGIPVITSTNDKKENTHTLNGLKTTRMNGADSYKMEES